MEGQPRDDGAIAVSAVTSVEPLQRCKRQVQPEPKKDRPWSKTVRAGACLVFNSFLRAHALKIVHPSIRSGKALKREVAKLRDSITSNLERCGAQAAESCGCHQLANQLAWPEGIAITDPHDLTCDEHQAFLQAFGKVFFQGGAIPDINLENGPATEREDAGGALERLAGRFLQLLEGSSVAQVKTVEGCQRRRVHQRLWGKKLKPLVAPSAKKGSSSALDSTTEKPVGASPPTTPDGATCGDCGSLAKKSSAGGSPDTNDTPHFPPDEDFAAHFPEFGGQAEQQSLPFSDSPLGQTLLFDNTLSQTHASYGPSSPSLADFYPGCFSESEPASFVNKDSFDSLEGVLERTEQVQQGARHLGWGETQGVTEHEQRLDAMAGREEAQPQQEWGHGGVQQQRQVQKAVALPHGPLQQVLEPVLIRVSGIQPQEWQGGAEEEAVASRVRLVNPLQPYQQQQQASSPDSVRVGRPVRDQCQQVLSYTGGDINRPLRKLVKKLVLRAMEKGREQITIQHCFFQCPSGIDNKIEFARHLHGESGCSPPPPGPSGLGTIDHQIMLIFINCRGDSERLDLLEAAMQRPVERDQCLLYSIGCGVVDALYSLCIKIGLENAGSPKSLGPWWPGQGDGPDHETDPGSRPKGGGASGDKNTKNQVHWAEGGHVQTLCTAVQSSKLNLPGGPSSILAGASLERRQAPLLVAAEGSLASEEEDFEKLMSCLLEERTGDNFSGSEEAGGPSAGRGPLLLHFMDLLQRVKDQLLSVDEAVDEFETLEPGTERGVRRLLAMEAAQKDPQQEGSSTYLGGSSPDGPALQDRSTSVASKEQQGPHEEPDPRSSSEELRPSERMKNGRKRERSSDSLLLERKDSDRVGGNPWKKQAVEAPSTSEVKRDGQECSLAASQRNPSLSEPYFKSAGSLRSSHQTLPERTDVGCDHRGTRGQLPVSAAGCKSFELDSSNAEDYNERLSLKPGANADGLIRFGDKHGHSGQQKVGHTEMGKPLEAAPAVRPRLKHLTYYNMLEATYYDSLERCKDQRHKNWMFEQCNDYEDLIFLNLKKRETRHPPLGRYLKDEDTDITADHRATMINWLVEFAAEFCLQMETLFRGVAIMDKFLSMETLLKKDRLQLTGIASLLLAIKLDEMQPPEWSRIVMDFCEGANWNFSKDDILDMEMRILETLKFAVLIPTAYEFIQRDLSLVNQPTITKDYFAEYLTGLALLDYDMLEYPASLIAAAAVFLASYSLDARPGNMNKEQILECVWPAALVDPTGYSTSDLTPCLKTLHQLHKSVFIGERLQKFKALSEKYQSAYLEAVVLIEPVDLPTWL